MKTGRLLSLIGGLIAIVISGIYLATIPSRAQQRVSELRPDVARALKTKPARGLHTEKERLSTSPFKIAERLAPATYRIRNKTSSSHHGRAAFGG